MKIADLDCTVYSNLQRMLHVDYFIECNTIHDLKKKNINKMWVSDDSFIVITNSLQKKKTLLNDITLSSIEY